MIAQLPFAYLFKTPQLHSDIYTDPQRGPKVYSLQWEMGQKQ